MTATLGISGLFHDSAAALVVDGQLVAAAQEERFSRKKNDSRLPTEAAAFCLRQAGLTIEDVDHVVFYEKPLRTFDRVLRTSLGVFPRGMTQFVRAMQRWLGDRLWIESKLASALGCDPDRLLFMDHHLSHAASAFLPSGYDEAAVVVMDGVGEEATTTIYHARHEDGRPRFDALAELHFPHSMGLMYSAITAYLGFKVNEGEYKVMGLAPYGTPRFRAAFDEIVTLGDDGSLTLNRSYFRFHRDPRRSFTRRLEALLGPARVPGTPLDPDSGDADAQRYADIAATLQAVCEAHILSVAREARRLTGATHLCMAGGVALNSVANGRVATEAGFDALSVHPAAGDAGGSVGAALYVSRCVLRETAAERAPLSAYLGESNGTDAVEQWLIDCRVRHRTFDSDESLATHVAKRLADGEVGGWFQGAFEWGPRALGARSILADPRRAEMRDRVNAKVKFREGFRPFAPAVIADEAERWFALDPRHASLTRHMLAVVPMTEAGAAALPAVRHVDGTARVQTVAPADNPAFHKLLAAFRAQTGVGVLLNTSMNLRGEPICATPAEAVSVLQRSDLDFMVLERCLITRRAA